MPIVQCRDYIVPPDAESTRIEQPCLFFNSFIHCIINNYFMSAHWMWVGWNIADFALQEQPEDNKLIVSVSRAWCNGSYTTATKPIKTLELHYTMIQICQAIDK